MEKTSLILAIMLFTACSRELRNNITISGTAQGTTYTITYLAGAYSNYREEIDSIFHLIDQSLSTYQPTSVISKINRNETNTVDAHFITVFRKAMEVSGQTDGLFDVTVAPLVNAYGFGFTKKSNVDSMTIDSLRRLVGYQKVRLEGNQLIKESPTVILDFNAIAQGYTVDVLAEFLESKGIHHYLVELGGELRAKGEKLDGSPWSVGIQEPDENPAYGATLNRTIALQDKSLATSGNYKKFYVENGKKFSHIINPHTGYPAKNNLLSATVVADDCMTADAYATAFMVMGVDPTKQFLAAHKDLQLEVLLIYDDQGTWKTYISENFQRNMPDSR